MLAETKKQYSQDWHVESLQLNRRLIKIGAPLSIITYCGGTTLAIMFDNIANFELIIALTWLPAVCIWGVQLLNIFYRLSMILMGYTIIWSMSLSCAIVSSMAPNAETFRYISFTFFPIFIAFSLMSIWHWRYALVGVLVSMAMSLIAFYAVYHEPIFSIWLRTWLFIIPVGAGSIFITHFRYMNMRQTFLITRALQRSKEEIEKKNEDITASISYAQRIQQAILPTQAEIGKHIEDYFIFFRPRDVVSGDFYFFTPTDKGYIVAAIDCTGHGVPGAFMSMIGNEMLNEIINQRHISSPSQILTDLHLAIRSTLKQTETDNRDGMDLVLVHIDTATRQLAYAGAKNALYVLQGGELTVLKGNKMAIGGEQREQARIFEEQTLTLQESAMLYLTTDGYLDQFGGEQNKKFGIARFKELIKQAHSLPTAEQEYAFRSSFFDWLQKGNEHQIDDVLVWGIRV
ncbi:MAG: hypothetical protein EAZ95_07650 [Bacteroidetes bacterium]|nr:MAG: hypothetical protein EAZ95_07650 [Bacteroidota bacterium]